MGGKLAKRIGYQFSDPGLLEAALRHRSLGARHNERLEFLGDSVLGLAVSEMLFAKYPDASEGELKGILGYEERPLVSTDYTNDPRSGIVDAPSTMVINGTQAKIYVWYDNEWGYAHRLIDVALMVGNSLC